ncbi:MAG: potassium-transporting ATPase subunit KdpA [Gemmataceae bacterium]
MWQVWLLPLLIVGTTVALSFPVGRYLAWVLDGRYRAPGALLWLERRLDTGPQTWKQYAVSMLLFNTVMFLFGYVVLQLQPFLPLNPDDKKMLSPTTVFNTAASFLTNTNLQHYSGEQHLSYFSQLAVICWNMFVSAAVGFCALAAIIRGLRGDAGMGNFYLDMWRVVVYVFLPASLITGVLLLAAGVPMTFDGAAQVAPVEPEAMGTTDDGKPQPQVISRGPAAAVIPIKHLGTNGGGFFGANSAHPYENPNAWTNFLTCVNILIFPFSLVLMFGRMIGNMRHAALIYGVMMLMFLGMIGWAVYWDTLRPNPALLAHQGEVYPLAITQADGTVKHHWMVTRPGGSPELTDRGPAGRGDDRPEPGGLAGLPVDQELGNLEGKELRFGTSAGATFSAVTTAVTCGSVNCMHDSLNPLAGLTPLTGMWLNCVFGGKGVGLVNLLVYLIVGVFLAGLMVGRTPEYLGKKVEAREMKLAMLALLIHPVMTLGPAGLFAAVDWGTKATNNPGAHGFTEILYEFTSASANNGSGFEGLSDSYGFNDNPTPAPYSPHWDVATGLVMLLSRFIPIVAPLALAAGLAAKKPTPFTSGTMRTDTLTFGFVLLGTVILVGALLFLPAAVLGPVAAHLAPTPFGG